MRLQIEKRADAVDDLNGMVAVGHRLGGRRLGSG